MVYLQILKANKITCNKPVICAQQLWLVVAQRQAAFREIPENASIHVKSNKKAQIQEHYWSTY